MAKTETIINMTYSDLFTFWDNGWLVPGQKYKITDFRTRHTIPNVNIHGALPWDSNTEYELNSYVTYQNHWFMCDANPNIGIPPEPNFNTTYWLDNGIYINEASIEPLIVTAITPSSLAPEAYSQSYPKDIIWYNIANELYYENQVDPACDRGFIYFRKDTTYNVSAYEDWRNVQYARYERDDVGEEYILINDTNSTGRYVFFYMFDDGVGNNVKDINIGPVRRNTGIYYTLSNSVFMVTAKDSTIGNEYCDNTIHTFRENTIGDNFFQNTIYDIDECFIGMSCAYNKSYIVGDGSSWVNYLEACHINCTDSGWFYDNTILGTVFMCTFGQNCEHNTFNDIRMCTFEMHCFYNTFDGSSFGFQFNNFGMECRSNNITGSFYYNDIGHNFQSNTISGTFSYNIVGTDMANWNIGPNANVTYSTIANDIQSVRLIDSTYINYSDIENDRWDGKTLDPLMDFTYKHYGSGLSTFEGRIDPVAPNKAPWQVDVVYSQSQYVSYDDTIWVSLHDDNIGITPVEGTDWTTVGQSPISYMDFNEAAYYDGGGIYQGPYRISNCGIITLMGYGSGYTPQTISKITLFSSHDTYNNPKRIEVEVGFKVYLLGTTTPTESGQFYWEGSVVLDGNKKDYIILEQVNIGGFDVLREKK